MASNGNGKKITPSMARLMKVLEDGQPHSKPELMAYLNDELASDNALRVLLTYIRKVIRPKGQEIVAQTLHRKTFYRQVRLLKNPNKE